MATVLMGWELGGGLAHAARLATLARELAAHGHAPVLAAKDLIEPAAILREVSFPVLQAPTLPRNASPHAERFQAASYADVLAIRGFRNVDDLRAMLQGWRSLIDLVKPRLVLCDYSPTLCLAAFGRLPVVVLGEGFSVPPADAATFPPLPTGGAPLCPQQELLEAVQEAQRRGQQRIPQTLTEPLRAADRYALTLPELDPYRGIRTEAVAGPLRQSPPPTPPPAAPRVFAYLGADDPRIEPILLAMARLSLPISAYIRGASPALMRSLGQAGMEVFSSPQDLHRLIPQVSVVVHHGGLNTAMTVFSLGRPQVLLPRHLEQGLTAQALRSYGVGTGFAGRLEPAAVGRAAATLATNPAVMSQAMEWAWRVYQRRPPEALPRIVQRCLELIDRSA